MRMVAYSLVPCLFFASWQVCLLNSSTTCATKLCNKFYPTCSRTSEVSSEINSLRFPLFLVYTSSILWHSGSSCPSVSIPVCSVTALRCDGCAGPIYRCSCRKIHFQGYPFPIALRSRIDCDSPRPVSRFRVFRTGAALNFVPSRWTSMRFCRNLEILVATN